MSRDPSIHVKLSDLREIVEELGCSEELAERIAIKAKSKTPKNRGLIRVNQTQKKRVNRILGSEDKDAELFSNILISKRAQTAKTNNMKGYRKGTKDWDMLRDLASLANDFAEEFGLDQHEAYSRFIELGLGFMRKFALNRFVSLGDRIFETQRLVRYIKENDTNESRELLKLFYDRLEEYTGVARPNTIAEEKYADMIRGAEEAKGAGATMVDWIDAQIEGLSDFNAFPASYQLYGQGAWDRYERYMYAKKEGGGQESDYFQKLRERKHKKK